MEFTNLITIAIPVFERKEFFQEALYSVLNQSVKCKVIVIDNCSSHNYFEKVCKEKGVTFYRNETNIGVAANFAKAYELSETKYVMILQDDDILSSVYVETFVKVVNQYPDIDVFYTDFVMRKDQYEFPHKHILPFGYMENGGKIIEYGSLHKLGFPYMTSTIKKEVAYTVSDTIEWIGSYDWEWIYSIAEKLTFYGNNTVLYYARIHNKQITINNKTFFTLTRSYIYEKVLFEKVSDPKLKKLILRNAFWELIRLKSETDKKHLKELFIEDNKYDKYLKERLNKDIIMKTVYIMPKSIIYFTFKCLRKIGFDK